MMKPKPVLPLPMPKTGKKPMPMPLPKKAGTEARKQALKKVAGKY